MKLLSPGAAAFAFTLSIAAHAQMDPLPPPPPQPAQPPVVVVQPPPVVVVQAAPGPTARVHVVSPTPATLLHRAPSANAFERMCEAPCDVDVPLGDEFQISGKGQKMNVFRLNAQPGQTIVIECNPANESDRTRGIVFAIIGGVGFNVAIFVDYIAIVAEALTNASNSNQWTAHAITITGATLTIVTAALAIDGVVLLVGSNGSEPTQHIAANKLLSPSYANGGRTTEDAHRDMPWTRKETAAAPPALTVPIFATSF